MTVGRRRRVASRSRHGRGWAGENLAHELTATGYTPRCGSTLMTLTAALAGPLAQTQVGGLVLR